MNLASEFERLKNLKSSGVITEEEYERSKSRLLDACVGRIESLYDPNPPAPIPPSEPPPDKRPRVSFRVVKLSHDHRPPTAPVPDRPKAPVVVDPVRPPEPLAEKAPRVIVRIAEPWLGLKPPEGRPVVGVSHAEKSPESPTFAEVSHEQKPSDGPTPAEAAPIHTPAVPVFFEPLPLRRLASGIPPSLPPVKVISGVVQSIRLSLPEDSKQYAALVDIDGQQVQISSSASICVEAGDRVILSGYECDGRLLALAYHNESKGVSSNLDRVRQGYRIFMAAGRASWIGGAAALLGTLIVLILHHPLSTFNELWRYVPYAVSGLAGAATCGVGFCLCVLGARAKEFYDALPWATGVTHSH